MKTEKSVLIVDGDPDSRRRIIASLPPGPWCSTEAESAAAAIEAARTTPPDLVILDCYLPDISGHGLCRILREDMGLTRVPLLAVSTHGGEVDRVLAFEAGADDFVVKPFHPPELMARVRAILRGFQSGERSDAASRRGRAIHLDRVGRRAEVEGVEIDLTPREFEILATIVAGNGRVVRRRQLIDRLWAPDALLGDRAIDAHIKSIRRKLGRARRSIETVRGVGYRFNDLDPSSPA